ncbi:transcriptional regulator [Pinisolibacter sp.]|uniref:transcriptional regulator n=1 Tax=Pinisolibacter sp. TaxID=2172024 RepID=UPI002FDDDDE9
MSVYRYTESGLDNVFIEGVSFVTDDAGETCITVPNINGLHKAIATGIVRQKAGMTGREMRFLRTEIGLTQAELAVIVHREALAISRWERGEFPIDSNAEALIRLFAAQRLELESIDVKDVTGWCIPSAETPPIVIDGSDPSNYVLKAAA